MLDEGFFGFRLDKAQQQTQRQLIAARNCIHGAVHPCTAFSQGYFVSNPSRLDVPVLGGQPTFFRSPHGMKTFG